ncbi:MAG: metal ABC transporter permease [Candidatus Latescibacteria bacterium]|nr:metal ABC transporter permease [Candidatus Latescibacterota bacterium]
MFDALNYEFMRNALYAGILISIACGIIGSLVVVNRMVFISGGIAHASYGGIGLAFFLGIPPLLGAGLFSVVIALIIGILTFDNRNRSDTVIGVVWAAGMAFGIILIDLTPGYHVDIMSYLFGSILAVPTGDLWLLLILDIVIICAITLFYREFVAVSYDLEFAYLRGVPVKIFYLVLLVLASLTIIMTIRLVGLILVIALLTIPTHLTEKKSGSLGIMMFFSTLLSIFFIISGLWLSFTYNLTTGASIIIIASTTFFLYSILIKVKSFFF